jgi:hypothetical protein
VAKACSRSSRLTVGQSAVEDVVQGRGGALEPSNLLFGATYTRVFGTGEAKPV